jgi:hypothetical protein
MCVETYLVFCLQTSSAIRINEVMYTLSQQFELNT